MRTNYGYFGFLGWVLFVFVPSWGRELYVKAYEYFITFFDHMWDSTWRILLLIAAIDFTILIARHYGYKFRKNWISFLLGIFFGGLFQVLLAIYVFDLIF